MNSILLSLAWKEYRELKWSVLATCLMVAAAPTYYLWHDPSLGLFAVAITLPIYAVMAGTLFGAQAAASERVNRVAPFLAALPVSPCVMGAVKLLSASVAVVVPLIVLALLSILLEGPAPNPDHPPLDALLNGCAVGAVTTIHMLLMVAAFGAGRKTEVAAGIVGFGAFVFWGYGTLLSLGLTDGPNQPWHGLRWLARIVQGLGPPYEWLQTVTNSSEGDSFTLPDRQDLPFVVLPFSLLAFAAAFVMRYGIALDTVSGRRSLGRRVAAWLRPAMEPLRAPLLWKGLREIGPISLLVLAVVVLLRQSEKITLTISSRVA